MDLAKVGEVDVHILKGSGVGYERNNLNQRLEQGWVILSIKTVPNTDKSDQFLYSAVTVFTLGKPREKPSGLRAIADADEERNPQLGAGHGRRKS